MRTRNIALQADAAYKQKQYRRAPAGPCCLASFIPKSRSRAAICVTTTVFECSWLREFHLKQPVFILSKVICECDSQLQDCQYFQPMSSAFFKFGLVDFKRSTGK